MCNPCVGMICVSKKITGFHSHCLCDIHIVGGISLINRNTQGLQYEYCEFEPSSNNVVFRWLAGTQAIIGPVLTPPVCCDIVFIYVATIGG